MKLSQSEVRHQLFNWIEIGVITLLTLLALYHGETTVFYIIYLFWWREFLHNLINGYFKRGYNKSGEKGFPFSIPLAAYWILIISIFGFIAVANNPEARKLNIAVLLFDNIYFNLNLVYFIAAITIRNYLDRERIRSGVMGAPVGNMVIMHLSLILGMLIIFLFGNPFFKALYISKPWHSIVMVVPFLILQITLYAYRLFNLSGTSEQESSREINIT